MNTNIVVPSTLRGAGRELRRAFSAPLDKLPTPDFVRAWCAVAYAFPHLHVDDYDTDDSNWPRVLRRFAAEARRRNDVGELLDEEVYPCDAAWAGVYDRLGEWKTDEVVRRLQIAIDYGESSNA